MVNRCLLINIPLYVKLYLFPLQSSPVSPQRSNQKGKRLHLWKDQQRELMTIYSVSSVLPLLWKSLTINQSLIHPQFLEHNLTRRPRQDRTMAREPGPHLWHYHLWARGQGSPLLDLGAPPIQ